MATPEVHEVLSALRNIEITLSRLAHADAVGSDAYVVRLRDQAAVEAFPGYMEGQEHGAVQHANNLMRALGYAPPGDEFDARRREQAVRVMPLIGPLLDAWAGASLDARGYVGEDSPELPKILGAIDHAMEGE